MSDSSCKKLHRQVTVYLIVICQYERSKVVALLMSKRHEFGEDDLSLFYVLLF